MVIIINLLLTNPNSNSTVELIRSCTHSSCKLRYLINYINELNFKNNYFRGLPKQKSGTLNNSYNVILADVNFTQIENASNNWKFVNITRMEGAK